MFSFDYSGILKVYIVNKLSIPIVWHNTYLAACVICPCIGRSKRTCCGFSEFKISHRNSLKQDIPISLYVSNSMYILQVHQLAVYVNVTIWE